MKALRIPLMIAVSFCSLFLPAAENDSLPPEKWKKQLRGSKGSGLPLNSWTRNQSAQLSRSMRAA